MTTPSTRPPRSGTALRITAGTAVLAAAATGAIAFPSGAAHADGAPASTSISVRTAHARVAPGKQDTITGDLQLRGEKGTAGAGRSVTLEARAAGETAYSPVGTDTAGPEGGLRLTVTPESTTRYRWHYDGAADARARTSGTVRVRVGSGQGTGQGAHRLRTTLSIRATRGVSHAGDTVKGRLRSRHQTLSARIVVLLSRASGADGWRYVGAHRTGHDGQVAFRVHPAATTAYRLQYAGSTVFRPAHSGIARVRVVARPTATISADPRSIAPGSSTTVSTVVTTAGTAGTAGQPVAGAVLDLLAKPAAHPRAAFTRLASGITTAQDGSASDVVSPTRDTVYRWRVEAGAGEGAALSHALTVRVLHASSLSIRAKHLTTGYVVGGSLRSSGHPLAHRVVSLVAEAPDATTFTPVAQARTGRFGGVSFTRPEAAGTAYRLVWHGTTHAAPAVSGTVTD